MFRRTKQPVATPPEAPVKTTGKGRPTPSRKEAEAAARERAKAPRTRRERAAARRGGRENSARIRQGMREGDEKYLLPRDKGPVRRFIRDFVDSRFSLIELVIPLLILTMVFGYSGSTTLRSVGNTIMLATVLGVVLDMFMLRYRLRRQLAARFPDAPVKGTTYYAITRAMQMRFMRLPKPKVKIGQTLPEHHR